MKIDRASSVKYIGVQIDEHLSWAEHIDIVCSKLVKLFGIFYRIRNFITPELARTIYFACMYLFMVSKYTERQIKKVYINSRLYRTN